MDEKAIVYCLPLADQLRQAGFKIEIYPQAAKLKKQLDYANAKGISWVVIIGEDEMQSGHLSVKNMTTGEQTSSSADMLHKVLI
jgi:histidyl-tRNA synthetase